MPFTWNITIKKPVHRERDDGRASKGKGEHAAHGINIRLRAEWYFVRVV